MTINVLFGLHPTLTNFLGGLIVPLFEDLKAKIAELQAAAASEHEQVMAVLQSLQDSLNTALANSLSAEQIAELNADFEAAKAAVGGVYEPPVPPEPAPV